VFTVDWKSRSLDETQRPRSLEDLLGSISHLHQAQLLLLCTVALLTGTSSGRGPVHTFGLIPRAFPTEIKYLNIVHMSILDYIRRPAESLNTVALAPSTVHISNEIDYFLKEGYLRMAYPLMRI